MTARRIIATFAATLGLAAAGVAFAAPSQAAHLRAAAYASDPTTGPLSPYQKQHLRYVCDPSCHWIWIP
jgi:hypothetical protein